MALVKKILTVGTGTLASRLFGFIREIFMASALGTEGAADAFNAAFRFPNSFRRLFAEGALSSAFVPIFAKKIENEGIENAKFFANQVFGVLLTTLTILTIIAIYFMPKLVQYFIAPGFIKDNEKFCATIKFAVIMFPYLGCMSLTAVICGMLNSIQKYFAAAIAPLFLNFILIGILIYSYYYHLNYWQIATNLAKGVLISGIAQLSLVYFAAKKANLSIKFKLPHFTPEIRQLLYLAFPAAITGGITQVNLLINTAIASSNEGAISALAYADRLYQLPLGIIGISIGTVLLPELAKKSHKKAQSNKLQNQAIEFALLLGLPASIALFCFGKPIICLLLQHGKFGDAATIKVSQLLKIYAFGLPSFILLKTLVPNFFARQDTKTPLIFAALSVVLNITLAYNLFPYFYANGIAFAEITASWLNCALLFFTIIKRKYFMLEPKLIIKILKFLFAAIIMGAILQLSKNLFHNQLAASANLLNKISFNFFIIFCSCIIYFAILIILKAINLKMLKFSN